MNLKEYNTIEKAKEIFDLNLIDESDVGTFKSLQLIYKNIFEDVFDYAGEIRDVNISKNNFKFCSVRFLNIIIQEIDKMPQNNFNEIIEKYTEMNIAHPFREGNGRSMRIWLDMILKKELGKCVDWDKVDKVLYLQAMERSPLNTLELKVLLENSLTDKINDRNIFMKGIEKSYSYEVEDAPKKIKNMI